LLGGAQLLRERGVLLLETLALGLERVPLATHRLARRHV
jgi:hypothetical protein